MGLAFENTLTGVVDAIRLREASLTELLSRDHGRAGWSGWINQQLTQAIRRRPGNPLLEYAIGLSGAAGALVLGHFLKAEAGGTEPLFAIFPLVMLVTLISGPLAGGTTLAGGLLGVWYVFVGRAFSFALLPLEERAVFAAALIGVFVVGLCSLVRGSIGALGAVTEQLTTANGHLTEAMLELKMVQKTLVRSEEEFRVSFEASTVGKLQVDLDTGCIIRANRAFAHMLGYEPEYLVGRNGWEFTWPEDRVSDKAGYTRIFDGNTDANVREKRYLRKDGSPIWGRVSATRVRFPDSKRPDIVIAVVEDIEERHAAQVSLQAATHELEGVVKERTAALVQRSLLLREVYHRVKNNLQIVDSMLVMQSQQLTDPNARSALLSLRSRIFALGLVHHQLMGSSDLKTFDVSPFLHQLSDNLALGSSCRDVAVSVRSIPMDVGLDFAIPLGLLVTELVTNSIKHAFPSGKGAVEVTLTRTGDGSVALAVSDDGEGYSPGAASAGRASGLGTKIIAGLVAQLEGTMTSRNDKGTRTEIRFAAPVTT